MIIGLVILPTIGLGGFVRHVNDDNNSIDRLIPKYHYSTVMVASVWKVLQSIADRLFSVTRNKKISSSVFDRRVRNHVHFIAEQRAGFVYFPPECDQITPFNIHWNFFLLRWRVVRGVIAVLQQTRRHQSTWALKDTQLAQVRTHHKTRPLIRQVVVNQCLP